MGHQRLKKLPRSRWWDQVVELLDDGGSAVEIAGATARAIDAALALAARDPALTEAVLLLATVPGAARQPDYVRALGNLGVSAGASPSVVSLLAGVDRAIDREARMRGNRTDLGEMAQLAAASSLANALTPDLPKLFGTTPEDVRGALAKLDTPDRFAKLSRAFFADLMQRSLEYYLSRTYARFIGPGQSFASLAAHEDFRTALSEHCYETALILEQYSADWFSKSKFKGGITRQRATVLSRTALSKLRQELSLRNRPDG
jgi:hypothetical protein